jgi:hypothetical protein
VLFALQLAGNARHAVAADESVCTSSEASARRRPGAEESVPQEVPCDPNRLPLPHSEQLPEPQGPIDRWRIVDALGYPDNPWDPYSGNNALKGDRPVRGNDGFVNLSAVSNSLMEFRRVPSSAAANEVRQVFMSESASFDALYYRGDTVFRPPDMQVRFTPLVNYSRTQANGTGAGRSTFSAQALFYEQHLRDVSDRYDFDSVRVGIQTITSDPRGFLLLDQPAGVRLFGTRAGNTWQYSVGWFRPLAKNTARQNDLGARLPNDDLFVANLYRQDFIRPGLTAGLTLIHDRNRDGTAPSRVSYLGLNADGHAGRLNVAGAAYYARGTAAPSALSGDSRAQAWFAATELSLDFDWVRPRLSALHASGDGDLQDGKATGFGGLNATPLFAGADSSFFLHQRLPLTATIDLKQRDRLFTDLRSADGYSPPSFAGPGLNLLGLGADLDVTPSLRLSLDANRILFAETAAIRALTGNAALSRDVGWDLSLNAFYRPFESQNVIVRLTGSMLDPSAGYRALYNETRPFSFFFSLVLAY